jgi:hypothetical protein
VTAEAVQNALRGLQGAVQERNEHIEHCTVCKAGVLAWTSGSGAAAVSMFLAGPRFCPVGERLDNAKDEATAIASAAGADVNAMLAAVMTEPALADIVRRSEGEA